MSWKIDTNDCVVLVNIYQDDEWAVLEVRHQKKTNEQAKKGYEYVIQIKLVLNIYNYANA